MWNVKGNQSTEQKRHLELGLIKGRNPTDMSRNALERQHEADISETFALSLVSVALKDKYA